ncbi:MAG TPA: hypothetical protein VHP83_14375, partial [Aggregatilineaceae bacterium]|nr:hypothetical protein [Aggregatilineaceae bacterium]
MRTKQLLRHSKLYLIFAASALLTAAFLLAFNPEVDAQSGSPLHPTFALLDENGENVLDSGKPVSTLKTCGTCHDTAFIASHSFHSDVGLSDYTSTGGFSDGELWDTSPGLFGRWDPLTYRYLSPEGDEHADLTTAEWIQVFGNRHVGGGPAQIGLDGQPLNSSTAEGLQNSIVDPETGELVPWDWQVSGVVEMNCFLCHFAAPNNQARIESLQAGQFQWANTATLLGTGIVDQVEGEWQWNPNAFSETGELREEFITVQDPGNANCGQCHGTVHTDNRAPLTLDAGSADQWSTLTTGQVFSPQRISESGLNLKDKEELARSWDVHAERVVGCTDCHYALNNPVYYQESEDEQLDYLEFDPRRIDVGDYLYRPLHEFAKGQSAQNNLASEFDNSMRTCETCHDEEAAHEWLPYQDRHMSAVSCETCHIPKLYAPAQQVADWTVLNVDGTPRADYRGIAANDGNAPLLAGYQPVLLPRQNDDDSISLAPYNLITSWYWVYGDLERPVPMRDLQAVWLDKDVYRAEVLAVFDQDADGTLDDGELLIDSSEKEAFIAAELEARGLENPRIMGEVRPYSINHDVAPSEWAIKDCQTCHSDESRAAAPMVLADRVPNGVIPTFTSNSSVLDTGEVQINDKGQLVFQPTHQTKAVNLYIFGHDNVGWIDALGAFLFLGTAGAVTAHSGMRYFSAKRRVVHQQAD